MWVVGSPLITTKSAFLPGAIADLVLPRKVNRTVQGRNLDRFDRRNPPQPAIQFRVDPRNREPTPSVAGGNRAGYEEPARLDEGMLQLHVALQQKAQSVFCGGSDRGRSRLYR